MLFKDLFNKEFMLEESIKKNLKIFYKVNLELYKIENQEPDQSREPETSQQPVLPPEQEEPQSTEVNQQPVTPAVPEQPEQQPAPETTQNYLPSVVTEDEVSVNDENKILRKFDGEIELSNNQKDTIQTLDDIISVLSEHKKDGEQVLDEFCTEIIQLLYSPNNMELNQKIDKKSSIFVELFYGYKKDDSVGVRFNKRKNSDTITNTMLIDNEIISAAFSVNKVNQKISEIRNYEAKK